MIELTFVHATSWSSDHYYFVFDGLLGAGQVTAAIAVRVAEEGWDEDLHIEHIEHVVR